MKDEPYAIIIDGKGEVSERTPGTCPENCRSTLQVISILSTTIPPVVLTWLWTKMICPIWWQEI